MVLQSRRHDPSANNWVPIAPELRRFDARGRDLHTPRKNHWECGRFRDLNGPLNLRVTCADGRSRARPSRMLDVSPETGGSHPNALFVESSWQIRRHLVHRQFMILKGCLSI